MRRIVMVHSRPQENDCYDAFASWLGSLPRAGEVLYVRWSELDGTWLRADDLLVSCLQDPVGARKAAALERWTPAVECVNAPGAASCAGDRRWLYPRLRAAGLLCPPDPVPVWQETRVLEMLEEHGAVLLKDLSRQMGKGRLVKSDRAFLNVADTVEDWYAVPYYSFGRELHRYVVAGEHVLPGVYADARGTGQWSCKASHMARLVRRWEQPQRDAYARKLQEFWDLPPDEQVRAEVLRAVHEVGCLDAALVDCTLVQDEASGWARPFFWELNPCLNLRPAEVAGKKERWWPAVGQHLAERAGWPRGAVPAVAHVDARRQVELLLAWQGYNPGRHWTRRT